MNLLSGGISTESFLMVFIAVFLIAYFFYKEWPEFKKRISGEAKSENEVRTVEGRLGRLEKRMDEFSDMLSRDYIRLNTVEKLSRANSKAIRDSLEERRIIMEALLACLVGLQGIGQESAVKEIGDAIREINAYLNNQAHINQEVLHNAEAPKINPNI